MTAGPSSSSKRHKQHGRAGAALVATPVACGRDAAAAASLTVWMDGAETDKRRARPALEAMAGAIHDVGAEPPAGNIAKLAVNLMVLASVETLAEALELAARGGGDRKTLAGAVTGPLFTGPVLTGYSMPLASRSE